MDIPNAVPCLGFLAEGDKPPTIHPRIDSGVVISSLGPIRLTRKIQVLFPGAVDSEQVSQLTERSALVPKADGNRVRSESCGLRRCAGFMDTYGVP